MPRLLLILLFLLTTMTSAEPMKLILDTDIASDCDDAGSVAMLNALADRGEVEVLGMMVSTGGPWGAPTLGAINRWYGRDVPIGTLKEPEFWSGGDPDKPSGAFNFNRYSQPIAKRFPTPIQHGDDAPDAKVLYRKILARQPDGSVVINSIGPLINPHYLLQTGPDEHSPLNGVELVKQKVKHLVVAGGKNPTGTSSNFSKAKTAPHTVAVLNDWPTPIVFVGNEVGGTFKTGWLDDPNPQDPNPARVAYQIFHDGDARKKRDSWDQAAVLFAVRGLGEVYNLSEPGTMTSDGRGTNTFKLAPDGRHRYLIKKPEVDPKLVTIIEGLMNQRREISR